MGGNLLRTTGVMIKVTATANNKRTRVGTSKRNNRHFGMITPSASRVNELTVGRFNVRGGR